MAIVLELDLSTQTYVESFTDDDQSRGQTI